MKNEKNLKKRNREEYKLIKHLRNLSTGELFGIFNFFYFI
jgi:hypothetical protein